MPLDGFVQYASHVSHASQKSLIPIKRLTTSYLTRLADVLLGLTGMVHMTPWLGLCQDPSQENTYTGKKRLSLLFLVQRNGTGDNYQSNFSLCLEKSPRKGKSSHPYDRKPSGQALCLCQNNTASTSPSNTRRRISALADKFLFGGDIYFRSCASKSTTKGELYTFFRFSFLVWQQTKAERLLCLLSLAARQIYRKNFPPVVLSNHKQDSTSIKPDPCQINLKGEIYSFNQAN